LVGFYRFWSKNGGILPVLTQKRGVDLIDFRQTIVPGIKLLKTSSSFKWTYEARNQGIYYALETIVLYQALHIQYCFS